MYTIKLRGSIDGMKILIVEIVVFGRSIPRFAFQVQEH
jgi:hypothetical protein